MKLYHLFSCFLPLQTATPDPVSLSGSIAASYQLCSSGVLVFQVHTVPLVLAETHVTSSASVGLLGRKFTSALPQVQLWVYFSHCHMRHTEIQPRRTINTEPTLTRFTHPQGHLPAGNRTAANASQAFGTISYQPTLNDKGKMFPKHLRLTLL